MPAEKIPRYQLPSIPTKKSPGMFWIFNGKNVSNKSIDRIIIKDDKEKKEEKKEEKEEINHDEQVNKIY